MMNAMVNSTTNRSSSLASRTSLLVLEPPRISNLPLALLTSGRHLVGSADGCAIRVPVEGVQPRHAMILVGEQLTVVKALDERTWVNDYPADETRLRSGDRLSIGPITYRVRTASADELNDLASRVQDPVVPPPIDVPPVDARPVHVPATDSAASDVLSSNLNEGLFTTPALEIGPSLPQPDAVTQWSLTPDGLIDLLTDTIASEVSSSTGEFVPPQSVVEPTVDGSGLDVLPTPTNLTLDAIQASAAELATEQARQSALWQEREATHQRISDELRTQWDLAEQQRVRLQTEADRLAAERAELQRVKLELDLEHAANVEARATLANDADTLERERAALDADRRDHAEAARASELQLATDRQAHANTHAELMEIRGTLEQERTQFAAERTAESVRRAEDIREQTAGRRRIHEAEESLQTMRLHQDALQKSLDAERQAIDSSRNELQRVRAQLDQRQGELAQAETDARTQQTSLDQHERQLKSLERDLASERQALDQQQRTIEADRSQLEHWQSRLQNEQQALVATRSELDALSESLRDERDEFHRYRSSMNNDAVSFTLGMSPGSEHITDQPRADHDHFVSLGQPSLPSDSGPSASQGNAPAPISMSNWSMSARSEIATPADFGNSLRSHLADAGHSAVLESSSVGLALQTVSEIGDVVRESSSLDELQSSEVPFTSETLVLAEPESVEETLTDVSARFGFGAQSSQVAGVAADPDSADASSLSHAVIEQSTSSAMAPSDSTDKGESTTESADSKPSDVDTLSSLRAQLAQMFDLTNEPQAEETAVAQSDETTTSDGPAFLGVESLLATSVDVSTSPEAEAASSDSSTALQQDSSESMAVDSSSALESKVAAPAMVPETPAAPAEEHAAEEENAWTRRLRELSAVAQAANPPPRPAVATPAPVADEAKPTESDDEFSIEAQLARLLGRSQTPRTERVETPALSEAPKPEPDSDAPKSDELLVTGDQAELADEPDRSHLQAGPRHRQNKHAVREEVQSFRAVAQMSARTALAKHSKNTAKSSFYLASGLTLASAAATTWFIGTYFYGTELHIWKGIACGIATIASGERLLRFSSQLRDPRHHSKTRSVTRKSAED